MSIWLTSWAWWYSPIFNMVTWFYTSGVQAPQHYSHLGWILDLSEFWVHSFTGGISEILLVIQVYRATVFQNTLKKLKRKSSSWKRKMELHKGWTWWGCCKGDSQLGPAVRFVEGGGFPVIAIWTSGWSFPEASSVLYIAFDILEFRVVAGGLLFRFWFGVCLWCWSLFSKIQSFSISQLWKFFGKSSSFSKVPGRLKR